MNKAMLIGNVTRDPEIRVVNDKTVVSFGLATNKKFTSNGEKKEAVEFHNITAWGKLADIIGQYVKRGHKLYVAGEIRNRTWEKEGEKHNRTEIVIDDMEMLTPKNGTKEGIKRPDGSEASGLPEPTDYATNQPDDGIRVEDIQFD